MKRLVSFALTLTAAVASAEPSRLGLSLAWFGENISHPGARVGIEYALAEHAGHALVVGAGLGGWLHAGNTTGLFATADLGYRHTFSRGVLVEGFGQLGWMQGFLGGTAVTRADGVGFESLPLASNPAFIAGGTLGVGYDWSALQAAPLALTFRVSAFDQLPVNTVGQLHLALQLALTWKI